MVRRFREKATPAEWLAMLSATVVASLIFVAVAFAYTHSWMRGSAEQCFDTSGQTFNSWENVSAAIDYPLASVCAKARTASGNIRTGSGCDLGSRTRYSNIAGGTPDSHAYVYWTGTSPNIVISGHASTTD